MQYHPKHDELDAWLWRGERTRRQIVRRERERFTKALDVANLWYGPLLYLLEGIKRPADSTGIQLIAECMTESQASVTLAAHGHFQIPESGMG